MRYARILSIGLVATVAFAWSAAAIENADELAGYCQSIERGAKGAGRHIYIPSTREALTCWGYMQAMQDLSVLADENGHRIMGACPPEQTTTLQLIRSFVRYARAHRSELPGNAVVAVFRALRGAYPCRAEHGIPARGRADTFPTADFSYRPAAEKLSERDRCFARSSAPPCRATSQG